MFWSTRDASCVRTNLEPFTHYRAVPLLSYPRSLTLDPSNTKSIAAIDASTRKDLILPQSIHRSHQIWSRCAYPIRASKILCRDRTLGMPRLQHETEYLVKYRLLKWRLCPGFSQPHRKSKRHSSPVLSQLSAKGSRDLREFP